MGKATITVYGALRDKLGWKQKTIEFHGDNTKLKDLVSKVPELKFIVKGDKLVEGFIILINGIHAQFRGGINAIIKDGDEISIFPPGAGG